MLSDKNWIVLVLASVLKVPGSDNCSVPTSCVVEQLSEMLLQSIFYWYIVLPFTVEEFSLTTFKTLDPRHTHTHLYVL